MAEEPPPPGGPEGPLLYPEVVPVACFMKQSTWPRRWCLWLTMNYWDYISALVVILGCLSFSTFKPEQGRSRFLELEDILLTTFFLGELCMRVMAVGLYGAKGTLLRDKYNVLDLIILFFDVLSIGLKGTVDLTVFSDVLRPLRIVRRIPQMRMFVAMLSKTLPMFGTVMVMSFLVFSVFSTMSVQLWAGELRNRCYLQDNATLYNRSVPEFYGQSNMVPYICSRDGQSGMRTCDDIISLQENGSECIEVSNLSPLEVPLEDGQCVDWNSLYSVCRPSEHNPYLGAVNFDHFGFAIVSVFQIVTLEGWSEIMFMVQDAYSFWSWIFFVVLTIVGAFVMMNVSAVVITEQFTEAWRKAQTTTPEDDFWMNLFNKLVSALTRLTGPASESPRPQGLCVCGPLRMEIQRLVDSAIFKQVMILFAIVSTVVIAAEHDGQPAGMTEGVWICNIVFAIIFAIEMLLKVVAHSWAYFRDIHRPLEMLVVIVSVAELTSHGRFSVLFKFARCLLYSAFLRSLLRAMWHTLQKAVWFSAVLLLLLYCFSVLGMHIFGGKLSFLSSLKDPVHARRHWDDLHWAMVTVFQIFTQSDWNLVMYVSMKATNEWASLYFIAVIVLCKHLLLSVLVSIVVQAFHEQIVLIPQTDYPVIPSPNEPENRALPSPNEPENRVTVAPSEAEGPVPTDSADVFFDCEASAPAPSSETPVKPGYFDVVVGYIKRVFEKYTPDWCRQRNEWALFLLSPENRCRRILQRVVSCKVFKWFIFVAVLANCVTVPLESPSIEDGSEVRFALDVSGYVFAVIFTIEMILKVLAHGLVSGQNAYLRSGWNRLDGVLVMISVVDIAVTLSSAGHVGLLGFLKILRLLRTLRPLRALKQSSDLRVAVEAVITCVKPLGNVFLISCIFFFFYALLGMQLFRGKFYNCQDQEHVDFREVTTKAECLALNHRWVQRSFNFDNVFQALMTLFVMYSQDGWTRIMYDGIDAVAVDVQPVNDYNEWMILYFMSFMVMSFFLLDMFISTVVDTYSKVQKEQQPDEKSSSSDEASGQEPEDDRFYLDYPPLRLIIYRLTTSRVFELLISISIFLSVLVMAFEHYNMDKWVNSFMEISFFIFTGIFGFEIIMKLVAFGKRFFNSRWNTLDFAVVVLSLISIVLTEVDLDPIVPINPSILRVLRVLRLAHVLKSKRLQVLVIAVVKTLQQVGNLCLLFGFFFYIYAVLGVELLGEIDCSESYPCVGLHPYADFQNFGRALMALYRICTGDNWSGMLLDMLRECRPDDDKCLPSLHWVAPLFSITFVIMVQFMLVNLVVAAIMQALEDAEINRLGGDLSPPLSLARRSSGEPGDPSSRPAEGAPDAELQPPTSPVSVVQLQDESLSPRRPPSEDGVDELPSPTQPPSSSSSEEEEEPVPPRVGPPLELLLLCVVS